MEEKLEAHRAKKRRQALFNKYKNYLFNMVSFQNHTTIDINSKKNDDEGDDNRSIEVRVKLILYANDKEI